jgi:hypothetical protein
MKKRDIPKVHTEENSLVLIRIYAAGDEGDGEQVDEQKSNRSGGNGPNQAVNLWFGLMAS